jgi:hypothetical protein
MNVVPGGPWARVWQAMAPSHSIKLPDKSSSAYRAITTVEKVGCLGESGEQQFDFQTSFFPTKSSSLLFLFLYPQGDRPCFANQTLCTTASQSFRLTKCACLGGRGGLFHASSLSGVSRNGASPQKKSCETGGRKSEVQGSQVPVPSTNLADQTTQALGAQ